MRKTDWADLLWNRFEQTGSIQDYLTWKNSLREEDFSTAWRRENDDYERDQSQRIDYPGSPDGG